MELSSSLPALPKKPFSRQKLNFDSCIKLLHNQDYSSRDEKGSAIAFWLCLLLPRIDDSFFPVMETQLSDVYKVIGQRNRVAFFLRPLMDHAARAMPATKSQLPDVRRGEARRTWRGAR